MSDNNFQIAATRSTIPQKILGAFVATATSASVGTAAGAAATFAALKYLPALPLGDIAIADMGRAFVCGAAVSSVTGYLAGRASLVISNFRSVALQTTTPQKLAIATAAIIGAVAVGSGLGIAVVATAASITQFSGFFALPLIGIAAASVGGLAGGSSASWAAKLPARLRRARTLGTANAG